MPTLLDAHRHRSAREIDGVEQTPIEGVSFAGTLDDPQDPGRSRHPVLRDARFARLYHDGWKAVVFRTPPFIAYDGSDTTLPFDEDVWELYHVAEDFSEVDDLAAAHPEKLAELKELWWREAERSRCCRSTTSPGVFGDPRYRRDRYEFRRPGRPAGRGDRPQPQEPVLCHRRRAGAPARPGATGVIVAHGGHAGGYALFVEDDRLHFTYNYVATEITTVTAEVTLPSEPVTVRAPSPAPAPAATWSCSTATSRSVAAGRPTTTPLTYGTPGFAIGFQPAGPIRPGLTGRAELRPPCSAASWWRPPAGTRSGTRWSRRGSTWPPSSRPAPGPGAGNRPPSGPSGPTPARLL